MDWGCSTGVLRRLSSSLSLQEKTFSAGFLCPAALWEDITYPFAIIACESLSLFKSIRQNIGQLQRVEEHAFSWCLRQRRGLLTSLLRHALSSAGMSYDVLQHTQGYQERKLLLGWVKDSTKFILVLLKHQKACFL